MTEPSRDPASRPPAAPRWVKVLAIVAIALIVIVVIGLITGQLGPGGRHGPGRHLGACVEPALPAAGNAQARPA